jgi:hypothetical protein
MNIFKKADKPVIKSSVRSIPYPIPVKYWKIHYKDLRALFEKAGLDLNELQLSGYLRCKVVPDPGNEYDKNALKVLGAPKGGRTFFDIGFVPSEYAPYMKDDIKRVDSGSHYWSLRYYFDVSGGLQFNLSLAESKFAK